MSRRRGFGAARRRTRSAWRSSTPLFGVAAGLAGEGLAAALAEPVGAGRVRARAGGAVAVDVRRSTSCSCRRRSRRKCASTAQRLPAGGASPACVRDGRRVGADRQPVRRRAAGRRACSISARRATSGSAAPALFSLAAGMSVPLLLVGASAGALLPRAGALDGRGQGGCSACCCSASRSGPCSRCCRARWRWRCGACLRSGTAAMADRATAGRRCAAPPRRHRPACRGARWRHAVAALLGLVGVLQIVGAAAGGTDPLQPLARFASQGEPPAPPRTARALHAGAQRRRARRRACASAGRPVMLDFYADWCVSCKEMERFTFADPAVQRQPRRRRAAAGRRHREQRRGPRRCCSRFQPVRAARNDLLRRRRPRDRARRA